MRKAYHFLPVANVENGHFGGNIYLFINAHFANPRNIDEQ